MSEYNQGYIAGMRRAMEIIRVRDTNRMNSDQSILEDLAFDAMSVSRDLDAAKVEISNLKLELEAEKKERERLQSKDGNNNAR